MRRRQKKKGGGGKRGTRWYKGGIKGKKVKGKKENRLLLFGVYC